MQTFPTQVPPTKGFTMADVANQNGGAQLNKPSTDNAKTSFQAELNRQVRAKQNQAQTKQDKVAEPNKSQVQSKDTIKDESVGKPASSPDDLKNGQVNDTFLTDLSKQLDAANNLSRSDIANANDANTPAVTDLISALGIPSAPGLAMQSLQNSSNDLPTSATLASGDVLVQTDAITSQKGLTTAFKANTSGQAELSQDDAAATVNESTVNSPDKAVVSINADEGQSKTKLNAEESAFNKALTNLAAKDVIAKDIATSNVQQTQATPVNAVQNNNFASQQLASTNMINVYPGKSGWDQAISQKVVWMVGAGQQSATLTLNPPDLGPLKVVINVHNDQADTTFISDNDEVRKALESGMSNLRDKMNESGIQLGQANVSTSQQSQQEYQQATQDRALQNIKNEPSKDVVDVNVQSKVTTIRVSDGLVDTFA